MDSAPLLEQANILRKFLENTNTNTNTNTNIKDSYGNTALIIASRFGYIKVIKKILKHVDTDIDINNCFGDNSLIIASFWGHIKIVRELIKHGADINIKNNKKFNAIMFASLNGHNKVVILLQRQLFLSMFSKKFKKMSKYIIREALYYI
jgi:ankyrin repeat protein